jgi:excisionase family DNA binding protein
VRQASGGRHGALGAAPIRPLFTTREAAEYLGISRTTLNRMRDRGDLKGRKVGSLWRYRIEDLDAVVKEQPAKPGADDGRPAIQPRQAS